MTETGTCETVTLRNGLCLVAYRHRDGSLEAQHDNPICREAAQAMADELNGPEPCPTGAFNEMAESFDVRVRLRDAVSRFVPSDVAEKVADALEIERPWNASKRDTCDDPDLLF